MKELESLRAKYASLLTTAKSHEGMAGRAAREGQLRAEEVKTMRLPRRVYCIWSCTTDANAWSLSANSLASGDHMAHCSRPVGGRDRIKCKANKGRQA